MTVSGARRLLFGRGSDVPDTDSELFFECRRCGTTVDAETDECPVCESESIVVPEID